MTSSLFHDPPDRGRHLPGESLCINGGLDRLGEGLDADPALLLRRLIVSQVSGKRIERTVRLGLGLLTRVHV